MSIERVVQLPYPVEQVVDWFSRPGAVRRLLPPWLPLRVVREAQSLREGTAVMRLPAGVEWVARHRAGDYEPGRRFVDEVVPAGVRTLPTRPITWRHEHLFEPVTEESSRVVDRVTTNLPQSQVWRMLAYRHRQLLGDLAAHERAAQAGMRPITIAVTGSGGLVGTALCALLGTGGHRVIRLVRRPARTADERTWDPQDPAPDLLEGCDALIHLAGASIYGRFGPGHRRAIEESRIEPTRRLAGLVTDSGVQVFVCASAVGYYGAAAGDRVLDEREPAGVGGADFLSDVVRRWELAAREASDAVRCVQLRTGVVLDASGGMLGVLRPLYAAGLGGPIAGGRRWLSWIGLDDLLEVYHRALWDPALAGPVNAVSPEPVRNAEFSAALAAALHRPAVLPVPRFAPGVLLGRQGSELLALADQRAIPGKLAALDHAFRTPGIGQALGHTLGRSPA